MSRKLDWPPTAYGKMMFDYVLSKYKRGEMDKETATDILDAWFEQPPAA